MRQINSVCSNESYGDVEKDDTFIQVVGDVGRLHPHIGHIDGAREQKENSQAGQQQAQSH